MAEEWSGWSGFDLEVSGEPATAMVDPAKLRSMLLAMIESAQWWGEEGPVEIIVSAPGEPTVRVRRRGTELDAAGATALFRPRPPGSRGGSKVGLYVAKGLAEAQAGQLESDTRDGIAFTLTLPSAV